MADLSPSPLELRKHTGHSSWQTLSQASPQNKATCPNCFSSFVFYILDLATVWSIVRPSKIVHLVWIYLPLFKGAGEKNLVCVCVCVRARVCARARAHVAGKSEPFLSIQEVTQWVRAECGVDSLVFKCKSLVLTICGTWGKLLNLSMLRYPHK